MGEAQGLGGLGCEYRGFFVGRDDRAEGETTSEVDDLFRAPFQISEIERNRSTLRVFFQDLALIGTDCDFDIEPMSGFEEIADAVRCRGDQEEQAIHHATNRWVKATKPIRELTIIGRNDRATVIRAQRYERLARTP